MKKKEKKGEKNNLTAGRDIITKIIETTTNNDKMNFYYGTTLAKK
jgi:hypothetical protein